MRVPPKDAGFQAKKCGSLPHSCQSSRSPTKPARSGGAAIEDEGDSPKMVKLGSSKSNIRDSFDSEIIGKSGAQDGLEDAIRVDRSLQYNDDEDFVLDIDEILGRC